MKDLIKKIMKPKAHRHILDREKRRDARIRANEDFIVEYKSAGMRTASLGEGRDLSKNGVKFAVPRKLKKGERVTLLLVFNAKFKAKRKLALEGVVRHVQRPRGARRYRMHCQFIHASEESRTVIAEFIEWLKSNAG